jgi:hypothetical protein
VDLHTTPLWPVAWVGFTAGDNGSSATGPLTATVILPPGTQLTGPGYGWDGWTCQAAPIGAACRHAALPARGRAAGALLIGITSPAACGQPVRLDLSSPGARLATATSARVIRCRPRHH